MIDLEFLQRLIQALDESSLDSIEIERGGTRVRLSKSPPPAPMPGAHPTHASDAPSPLPGATDPPASADAPPEPAAEAPTRNLVDIPSPMVGTFYRAPGPDAPPYVEAGGRIARGDTLCIIEAMKLMNELEAEVAGTVVEVCVENAEPVEYGQVLFRIDPA
ncbi:MAG TPA: acetyl-CoA carboxylase biotin carboxyl carrier protein [Longimicrobiales bacterium]|jgi:acetyl-CoA carboxylase biotin carboxyl carrier protein